MRVVFFCHSIISDWNNGNAHFFRGVASELMNLGHDVTIYEPVRGWSIDNLTQAQGDSAIAAFNADFPAIRVIRYDFASLDFEAALRGVSLVIVHEWNEPELIAMMGAIRLRRGSFVLLFHDTHHRAVSDCRWNPPLEGYDGVLAFGESLRELYLRRGWAKRVWTWHEAADTSRFHPIRGSRQSGDVVWIGNWGDGERSSELAEYLLKPVKALSIDATVYGVRYPAAALGALTDANIFYAGWTPNSGVPEIFSRFRLTVHIPRAPYLDGLRGIPTIRVFEALACGIPLVSAPWDDCEHLFSPGEDFLVARSGREMEAHMRMLLHEPETAHKLAEHGLKTVAALHSCHQRTRELLSIYSGLRQSEEQPGNAR